MHAIVDQLRNYFRAVSPLALLFTSLLTAVLITLNYTMGIESRIVSFSSPLLKFTGFVLLFAFTFCGAWLMQTIFSKENIFAHPSFYALLLLSPIIFAGKVTFDWFPPLLTNQLSYPWDQYWNVVLNWPLKGLLVFITVGLIWRWGKYFAPVAGLSTKNFTALPLCQLSLLRKKVAWCFESNS